MANIKVKDADGLVKYRKATGAGSDGDPYITQHLETNSASSLTALQNIETAVELLDNAIIGNEMQVDVVSSSLPANAATENTLSAVKTAVELLDNAISGNEMQVDIVSSALPTGASTSANQTTIIGHVDGIETLLTAIDTDTSSMNTDLGTLAGAVTGSEMQVDIVSAPTLTVDLGVNNDVTTELETADLDTGAGTDTQAVVGLLGSADGGGELIPGSATNGLLVNLGSNNDVTVSNTIDVNSHNVTNAGTFVVQEDGDALTALQLIDDIVLTEDSLHVSGDEGVMALAVRQDSDAAFGGDGDYSPLQLDSNGYLKVNIKAGAGSGGTASTDDDVFTAGSGQGTPAMGFVTTDTVNAGDVGVLGMDTDRNLKVSIEVDNVGIGGGTQYDEGNTDASITGTAILWEDTGDTLRAISASYPLPVDITDSTIAVTQSGNWDINDISAGTQTNDVKITLDGENITETNSAAILADTANMDTNLATVAGAVTGSEMQVDIVAVTPDLMLGTDFSNVLGTASIVDGSNHLQVDIAADSVGIGGGTQYDEGNVDASITGTAMLWEDSGDTLRAISSTYPLPVDITDSTIAVTQSGNWDINDISAGTQTNDVKITLDGESVGVTMATLPDTAGGDLADIETNTDFGTVTGGGVETNALRVTIANNSTGVLSVDDNDSSLTIDNADITTIAGAVSGGQMQVDIVADGAGLATGANQSTMITALQLIDNPVATISATDLFRVAIYDDSDSQITSFGGGTQYTEDDPVPANPVGNALLAERDDALGGITPAEGDWTNLFVDANGALWTHDDALDAVISGGELQVDIVGALPTGDNNIGNVDIASSVQLDVSAATVTVDATNLDIRDLTNASDSILVYGSDDGGTTKRVIKTDTGGAVQVDIESSALPTGASTSANQTTIIGHVDGIEGLLTSIDTDTSSMNTDLGTIAGAVSGNEMQVDIVAVTPDLMLGTDFSNVLGTASIVDGSNHLQVDIAADSVGIGGGTQYTEDDSVPANPIGTAMMMERDDALGGITPAEGDWTHPFATAEGALWVQDFNSDAILADTANMDTNLGTIAGAVSGSEMQVDIVAVTPDLMLGTDFSTVFGTSSVVSGSEVQVDVVASLPAGTNTIGSVNIEPQTTGGCSIFRSLDVDETEEEIKATAGQIYSMYLYNSASAERFIKFYNATAATVVVGTTTPVLTFELASGQGLTINEPNGIAFGTAICIAATTAVGDSDTGAPGANEVLANVFYK